jgi:hypothetical protein
MYEDMLSYLFGPVIKTPAKLKRTTHKSQPDHDGTIPEQQRIYMSSQKGMALSGKAWRILATLRFPRIVQWFHVFACGCTLGTVVFVECFVNLSHGELVWRISDQIATK